MVRSEAKSALYAEDQDILQKIAKNAPVEEKNAPTSPVTQMVK